VTLRDLGSEGMRDARSGRALVLGGIVVVAVALYPIVIGPVFVASEQERWRQFRHERRLAEWSELPIDDEKKYR